MILNIKLYFLFTNYSIEQNNTAVFLVLIKEFAINKNRTIDEIIDADGETLLMVAHKKQHHDLVQYMVQFCNADVNQLYTNQYISCKKLLSQNYKNTC